MSSTPQSYIAGQWHSPTASTFSSWDPTADQALQSCGTCGDDEIALACAAAVSATNELTKKTPAELAGFLRQLATEIEALGDELITTGMSETGLPEARLQGERGRTCGQIRAFADMVEEGSWRQASIDTAQPDRAPLPKPDVRALLNPIGPVAVFGASNFPFAFGSLGGDSAAALAAGNPIVVKGHPSHPMTSTLFAKAMDSAIKNCGFPAGTFSLLQGTGNALGGALVENSAIKAVGFTGSVAGGRALMDIAAKRPQPIPVFAEMGSINPVFILPDALESNLNLIATGLAGSISMGVGQFCTSPGLIVTLKGDLGEQLANELSAQARGVMLNPGIAESLQTSLSQRASNEAIDVLAGGPVGDQPLQPNNTLMRIDAERFLATPELLHEVFGPAALLVECDSVAQMQQVAKAMEGNLTATIHTQDYDSPAVSELLQQLSRVAGRVLFNGYPTGVEVCPSMQHGGPYPASSFAVATSVGTAAATRFTMRNAYQNCPDSLLPAELQNANPLGLWRLVDGQFTQTAVSQEA
ncbi:aldehyde dehydrogenase (NADP(+)) [bacterium SCSIO 12696]|nr:aldehyde dehydrogenase (NADP(+)) [bacterium SCSIO 12696]